jgi:hypothetical protein
MSRQTSPQLAHRHDGFLHWIRDLAADQPFWLCRRLCAPRRFIAWHLVPIRRSLHLRRGPRFGAHPIARAEAIRTPTSSLARLNKPYQGRVLTKLWSCGGRSVCR